MSSPTRTTHMLASVVGVFLTVMAAVVLVWALLQLALPDYIAGTLLSLVGLSLLHGGVELLRPTTGE